MNKELKENIMQGTLQAFNQKGLKFTMDDIAKILGISKKTIYQVFRDKEALFLETVDYLFDRIKDSEQKIVENQEMDTLQKIHTILGVMPECYQDVDFRQLYQLKEKYPEIPFYPVDTQSVKVPAAWLIDKAGWKNKMLGGAAVHDKQCLVLINKDNAVAKDIIDLAQNIVDSVKSLYGITIKPEVNYI